MTLVAGKLTPAANVEVQNITQIYYFSLYSSSTSFLSALLIPA